MSEYPIPADLHVAYHTAARRKDLMGAATCLLIERIARLEAERAMIHCIREGLDSGLQVAATHADDLRNRLERAEAQLAASNEAYEQSQKAATDIMAIAEQRAKRLERAEALLRECVDPSYRTPAAKTVEHVCEFLGLDKPGELAEREAKP
jgi:chromosome segregation ATPase